MMIVVPGNASHQGTRREQQDSFSFTHFDDDQFIAHGGIMAVIADGMGGLAAGKRASAQTVQAMRQSYERKEVWERIPDALVRSLGQANKVVFKLAQDIKSEDNVGTTLVAAVVHEENLYWISVGDSRLYLCRKGQLTCLTIDHNYGRELDKRAARGEIRQEEARNHRERKSLTSYVGGNEIPLIDRNIEPMRLEIGDRLLLCSDGLYDTVSDEDICRLLTENPQSTADKLIEAALAERNPNQDNITAMVLEIKEEKSGKRFLEQGKLFPSFLTLPEKLKSGERFLNQVKSYFRQWMVMAAAVTIVLCFIGLGIYWLQPQRPEGDSVGNQKGEAQNTSRKEKNQNDPTIIKDNAKESQADSEEKESSENK